MAKKPKFKLAELGDRVRLRGRPSEGYLISDPFTEGLIGGCFVWWDYFSTTENFEWGFGKGPYKREGPWMVHINELERLEDEVCKVPS